MSLGSPIFIYLRSLPTAADLAKAREAQKQVDKLMADNASLMQKLTDAQQTIQQFNTSAPEKEKALQQLQKEIRGLQQNNAQFSSQIDQLKTDPKRIEKEAREQFHYARPGEVIYVSPAPPAPQRPATRTASK